MRSIKLTLVCMGIAVCGHAQVALESDGKDKNDLSKEKLNGKVKSIATTGFAVQRKDGKLQKGRKIHTTNSRFNDKGYLLEFISSDGVDTVQDNYVQFKAVRNTYNYDNNGVLVSNSRYSGNGKMEDSATYKVDSKGNRIDWNTYKSDGTVEWNYNREFDNQGNLIESSEYYRGKLKNRHTYKYDDNLNIVEENFYECDGRLRLKELFKYDSKKNVTEVVDYNRDGIFQARYTYVYDDRGNQIEERAYATETAKKFKKVVTKYDSDNLPVEVNEYNEIGKLVYQCKLDKRGNHVSDATYTADGKLKEKITQKYVYDERGNEIENLRYAANGKVELKNKNIYSYDKENNWFLKITYENDKPKRITERFIDYYE